jgi:hypothetical protein
MKYQVPSLIISAVTLFAQGQSVVDQTFVPDRNLLSAGGVPEAHAQTFTVGIPGSLTGFEVYLFGVPNNSGPMSWQIRSTVAGAPVEESSTILASGAVPASSLPPTTLPSPVMVSFQLPPGGVGAHSGDVLAIVLSPAESYYWGGEWGLGTRDPYSAGSHFALLSDGSWVMAAGVDMGFRTFVQQLLEPRLTITSIPNAQVHIAWATNHPGYTLEAAPKLSAATWTPVTNSVAITDARFSVIAGIGDLQQVFRLRKP